MEVRPMRLRTWGVLLVAACLAAGCKRRGEEAGSRGTRDAGPAKTQGVEAEKGPVEVEAKTVKSEEEAVEAGEIPAGLFQEGPPRLVGPLAGIRPGRTRLEEIAKRQKELAEKTGYTPPDMPGLIFRALSAPEIRKIRDDRADVCTLKSRIPGLADAVRGAWGQGTRVEGFVDLTRYGRPITTTHWFDPEAGIRAWMIEHAGVCVVTWTRLMPMEKLIGAAGKGFGFERQGAPLLGLPMDRLETAYAPDARRTGEYAKLIAAPTELSRGHIVMHVTSRDGLVNGFSFDLPYAHHPGGREAVAALFARKWGEPRHVKRGGLDTLVYQDEPLVEVLHQSGIKAWKVRVARQALETP